MQNQNNVLYYPTIEFQDYEWLWGASLLWDRIYKIVPEGYEPDEPENVKILQEGGEIGIPIDPQKYTKEISREFIKRLKSKHWNAAALIHSEDDDATQITRLHESKVDEKLKSMLIAKGQASSADNWLNIPTEFSSQYMTYLANSIAQKNSLQLVTDYSSAWTCSNYFRYDGKIEDFPFEDLDNQLAILVIRDFLPINIASINPNDLLHFREKRQDQRQRFVSSIKTAIKKISSCNDTQVIRDMIIDLKKDIELSLREYKKSADLLKIAGWSGIQTISFPVLTKIFTSISSLDPGTLTILSGLGIAIGAINGFRELTLKQKKMSKECDYSYLIELRRKWKRMYRDSDYNYYLCRQMEEFIND